MLHSIVRLKEFALRALLAALFAIVREAWLSAGDARIVTRCRQDSSQDRETGLRRTRKDIVNGGGLDIEVEQVSKPSNPSSRTHSTPRIPILLALGSTFAFKATCSQKSSRYIPYLFCLGAFEAMMTLAGPCQHLMHLATSHRHAVLRTCLSGRACTDDC